MHRKREQGFILVTVIMVLALVAIIGATLLVKSTSEMRQSGNSELQARARGYAEAAQADMFYNFANPGLLAINTIFTPYADAFALSSNSAAITPIIPSSAFSAILMAVQTAFPNISNNGTGYTSVSNVVFRSLRSDPGSFNLNGQAYYLDYSITGNGALGDNKRQVITEGTLRINLGRSSLNQFILLANDGGSGPNGTSGFFDTSSVYDGPVHVNQNLALSGSPTFRAGLTVSGPSIFMNDAVGCNGFTFVQVTGQQASPGGCTTPNTYGQGVQYGTPIINLPTNATSQARAALGQDSTDLTPLSISNTCVSLGLSASCVSVPKGVYVPRNGGTVAGGIYIQGNADVTLSTLGALQVYTITDETGTTTTITVDYVAKTTTYVSSPGLPTVLTGVPNGQLFVSGNITSLKGPPRTGALPSPAPTTSIPAVVPPAIASQSKLNIASGGSVNVTGDVTYTDDPRTTPTAQNVLGIISGSDSVVVGDAAPNDLYITGAVLAGASGRGLGVQSPGRSPARGAIHLLGSLAEDTDQLRGQVDNNGVPTAGYADDFKFDQRFFNGAVAPPFFPATTKFAVQTGWPIQRTWNEQ